MLNELIEALAVDRGFYLSVCDFAGVLSCEGLALPQSRTVHATCFCDLAKSSPGGYERCIRAKRVCNALAVRRKTPFAGYCPFGLYEYVHPVTVGDTVVCVLYLGHLRRDPAEAARRLDHTARRLGLDAAALRTALTAADGETDDAYCRRVLSLAEETVRLLYSRFQNGLSGEHWAVRRIKDHLDTNYWRKIDLDDMARLCFVNKKYLGRLFRQETGMTFHEYLTRVRLIHCEGALRTTDRPILTVALENGFSTVTYFNRVFREQYGCTPSAWRAAKRQSE